MSYANYVKIIHIELNKYGQLQTLKVNHRKTINAFSIV